MKKNFKKIVSLMLVFCLATITFMIPAANAQAAKKFTKSFTKTVTLQAWEQCELPFKVKKDAKVTVTVSTNSTAEHLSGSVIFLNKGTEFSPSAKSVTVEDAAPKGIQAVYVTNYTSEPLTITIKLSASKAVLKSKKPIINSDSWG